MCSVGKHPTAVECTAHKMNTYRAQASGLGLGIWKLLILNIYQSLLSTLNAASTPFSILIQYLSKPASFRILTSHQQVIKQ